MPGRLDRLWAAWGGSAALALIALAGKLRHEYYFLALAPLAAVGIARALADLSSRGAAGPITAGAAAVGLCVLAGLRSASTWQTPREWRGLPEAAALVRRVVPSDERIVAPEPLLYYADRKGFRLEFEPAAIARALRESGALRATAGRAVDLLEAHSGRARYIADLCPPGATPDRRALHRAIRERSPASGPILVDRPGVLLLAALPPDSVARRDPRP